MKISEFENGNYIRKMIDYVSCFEDVKRDVTGIVIANQKDFENDIPAKTDKVGKFSKSLSEAGTLVWYADGKIKVYNDKRCKMILNDDCAEMFANLPYLTDISALKYMDASNVKDMSGMFKNCKSLTDFSPIKDWNVSKVEKMVNMFENTSIENVSILSKWNVKNLKEAYNMFTGTKVRDFTALRRWKPANDKVLCALK